MNTKRESRLKRARRTREHIKRMGRENGIYRLCVTRSLQHISAQIIAPTGGNVLASASSAEKELSVAGTKTEKAKQVGKILAERAKAAGVSSAASDRSGYKYHGRICALIESAREHGLTV